MLVSLMGTHRLKVFDRIFANGEGLLARQCHVLPNYKISWSFIEEILLFKANVEGLLNADNLSHFGPPIPQQLLDHYERWGSC